MQKKDRRLGKGSKEIMSRDFSIASVAISQTVKGETGERSMGTVMSA